MKSNLINAKKSSVDKIELNTQLAKTNKQQKDLIDQFKNHTSQLQYQLTDHRKYSSGDQEEDNTLFYENFLLSIKEDKENHIPKIKKKSSRTLIVKSGSNQNEKKLKKRNSFNLKSKFPPVNIKDINAYKSNCNEEINSNKVILPSKEHNNNIIINIKALNNTTNNNKAYTTPKNINKDPVNYNNISIFNSPHNNSKIIKPTSPKKSNKSVSYYYMNKSKSKSKSNKEVNKDLNKSKIVEHLEESNQLRSINELSKDGKNIKIQDKKKNHMNKAVIFSFSKELFNENKKKSRQHGNNSIKGKCFDNDSQSYALKPSKKKTSWLCCIPIH